MGVVHWLYVSCSKRNKITNYNEDVLKVLHRIPVDIGLDETESNHGGTYRRWWWYCSFIVIKHFHNHCINYGSTCHQIEYKYYIFSYLLFNGWWKYVFNHKISFGCQFKKCYTIGHLHDSSKKGPHLYNWYNLQSVYPIYACYENRRRNDVMF